MAAFLERAFDLPPGPSAGFDDVAPDHAHQDSINALYVAGVTEGCKTGPLRYCPQQPTTRAQMASLLHRARTLHLKLLELNVFYCGPASDEHDEAWLQEQVGRLQQHVDGFYRRESGYDASGGIRGTAITFKVGGILPADILPPGHNWEDQTLDDWHDKTSNQRWSAVREKDRWKDPCVSAAEAQTTDHRFVILVNINPGPEFTLGYGALGTDGPAISLTEERQVRHYGRTQEQFFYYTVAHEIGHAFYDWKHPLEDEELDVPTTEQIMSVMSRTIGMHEHSGTVRLDLAPGPDSAYIACYHLAQHNWVELDADGQCQRLDSTAPDEQGGPDDEDPSELQLRISWGSDASWRPNCPANEQCRSLEYDLLPDGEWPSPPFRTECRSKGLQDPPSFVWSGDPDSGCIFWDDDLTAQVVLNGIPSNEINWQDPPTTLPPTALPRAALSTSYPAVTDCWGRGFEWDGYQLGQCTSYVAWRLRENGVGETDHAFAGHYGFYNQWRAAPCAAIDRAQVARWGHAHQWDDCAERIGIKVDKSPAPGSVLVRNDTALDRRTQQFFGHLAYVEATNPDGSIVISDANYNAQCGIRTSHRVEQGTGPYQGDYTFIHFEDHAKRLAS